MAARKRNGLAETTRKRIQATMLVERLQKHVLGEIEMTSSQIKAAQVLLGKTLPDLQQIEADVTATQHVVSAEPMKPEDWESKYASADATTH